MDYKIKSEKCDTENCYNEKEFNNTNTKRLKFCLHCRIEKEKGSLMVKTTCYKCDTEITVLSDRIVHPLCEKCGENFDSWFAEELEKIENSSPLNRK
jgi:hypothetical protein